MRRSYLGALVFGGILAVASPYATAAAAAPRGDAHGSVIPSTAAADTVTGCLQKGSKANEFTLTAKNGKTYEVTSKNVALAGHVGHTVTLTGMAASEHGAKTMDDKDKQSMGMKDSGAMGGMHDTTKMGGMQKAGGAGMEAGNLDVTKLTMVSATCQ